MADINMEASTLTDGRNSYPGVYADGATRANGSTQILRKHGWYWLRPIRAYATKDGPAAIAETVKALRDAGLTVSAPGDAEEGGDDA